MSTSNLKISIAALSLCVSAVAIYIHLPYVIAAVSGSGAIEAVPLAIFAVSAIVALVSVIYLIRLAVSRAGDKKKIDFSGEEELGSRGRQQQNLVEGGRINTWKKTSEDMDKKKEMAKLEIEMVKVGVEMAKVGMERAKLEVERTKVEIEMANLSSHIEEKQDSRSQMDVARAIPQNNNASLPSPSGGPPPPPLPSSFQNSPTQPDGADLLAGIRSVKLNKNDGSDKKPPGDLMVHVLQSELNKRLKSRDAEGKSAEERFAKCEEEQRERREKKLLSNRGELGERLQGIEEARRESRKEKVIEIEEEQEKSRKELFKGWHSSGLFDLGSCSSNKNKRQNKQSFAPAQAGAPIEDAYEIDSDEELRNYEN